MSAGTLYYIDALNASSIQLAGDYRGQNGSITQRGNGEFVSTVVPTAGGAYPIRIYNEQTTWLQLLGDFTGGVDLGRKAVSYSYLGIRREVSIAHEPIFDSFAVLHFWYAAPRFRWVDYVFMENDCDPESWIVVTVERRSLSHTSWRVPDDSIATWRSDGFGFDRVQGDRDCLFPTVFANMHVESRQFVPVVNLRERLVTRLDTSEIPLGAELGICRSQDRLLLASAGAISVFDLNGMRYSTEFISEGEGPSFFVSNPGHGICLASTNAVRRIAIIQDKVTVAEHRVVTVIE